MKVALVNPPWTFDGSIYFGCQEPHLPLEFGYARQLLEREGHEVLLVDAQMDGIDDRRVRSTLAHFGPEMTALATAPSYLFWRCAQPELRVPMRTAQAIRDVAGRLVVVGPHGSTTPKPVMAKTGADIVALGECEETLVRLASGTDLADVPSIAWREGGRLAATGPLGAADMRALPALRWPAEYLAKHRHHHHRFDREPDGPGAEMEASRGCPYHCSFCAHDNFRDRYRKRPLDVVLNELDALIAAGVTYVYFIDEIFQPQEPLLHALAERPVSFGVQMRIDLWTPDQLELLGAAGCKSIETGIESISVEGRQLIDKKCRKTTEELGELLLHARKFVPFVQASLIDMSLDAADDVEAWRQSLVARGVWANRPVPLFPYPGSPDYVKLWGYPDDGAWERAHAHYLAHHDGFSDIQSERPVPLADLERDHAHDR